MNWRAAGGKRVKIATMSDDYLLNTLRFLRRTKTRRTLAGAIRKEAIRRGLEPAFATV